MPESEEEPCILDGPDFRSWPEEAPEMWALVLDLEAHQRIARALRGPLDPDADADARDRAFQLMDRAGCQLRAQLEELICQRYRVP